MKQLAGKKNSSGSAADHYRIRSDGFAGQMYL